MLKKNFIFFTFLLLTTILFGQTRKFKIITQDVNNFWEAVDSLKNRKDTTNVFQTLVIDRASNEFKVFIKKWNITANDYTFQIRHFPNFYKTLRTNSIKLINSTDSIYQIVERFEKLYPNFKNADICIAFGNFNTGGNISINGKTNLVYIGLEYHGLDSKTYTTELSTSTKDYVSRSNFFRTIIHELVHIQHKTHGRKIKKTISGNLLVNRIISEGIPDFIAKLIVVDGNDGNYYHYGMRNEKDLKVKLNKELRNFGSGDWFGGESKNFINKPRDLGYFMGSRIAGNFYKVKNLQNTNLTELIEIKNLEQFITESKYFEEF